MNNDCLFCKIINKEVPSTIVYEDEEVIAFNDIRPAAPIHILVVPKKHIATLVNLEKEDEKIIGQIFTTINKIAKEQGFAEKGFRVIANCGEDGCQEVKHVHFHLLAGKKLGAKIIK